MTPAQRAKAIEAVKAQIEDIARLREMEVSKNPFYMFAPPSG